MATASSTRYAGPGRDPEGAQPVRDAGARAALARRRPTRQGDAVVLVPLLAGAALLLAAGLRGAPAPSAAEGSLARQAWAVLGLHDLTYPGQPGALPLGWWQLAAWTGATRRAEVGAVTSGRELMVVMTLVGAALLWALAKRLGLPRWAAATAVVLLVATPDSLLLHRTLLVDTVATTWVLAALVLALDPARRLGAFTAATACAVVAALSAPSGLLLLPVVGWLLWSRSRGESRRYVVAVTLSVLLVVLAALLLVAAAGGDVLGRRTGGPAAVADPALGSGALAGAGAATLLALLVDRLRPLAVGAVVLLVAVLVTSRAPGPVVALLPLAALLAAGVAAAAWEGRPARASRPVVAALATAGILAAGILTAGVAAVGSVDPLRRLTRTDPGQPLREATAWVGQNVPRGARVLTEDAAWVDLVDQRRSPADVVGLSQPGVLPGAPADWRAYRWVLSGPGSRPDAGAAATLDGALRSSRVVAAFGLGADRVEVRRVLLEPASAAQVDARRAASRESGRQLTGNPRLSFSPQARSALASGRVDPRLLTVLALVAGAHDLQVQALPRSDAETAAGADFRTLRVTAVDGQPVTAGAPGVDAVTSLLAAQSPSYRPTTRVVTGEGLPALDVSYPAGGS